MLLVHNVRGPTGFDAINNDPEQQKKSQYISFFKKPILPELYFKIFNYKYLKKIWRKSSDIEISIYLEVFSQYGALKSSLNWYRANFNDINKSIGNIFVPTLILYGIYDMAIGETSVDNSENYLTGFKKIKKIKAGHWLIQQEFEQISEEILLHINLQH